MRLGQFPELGDFLVSSGLEGGQHLFRESLGTLLFLRRLEARRGFAVVSVDKKVIDFHL
jgi:hypothetical protein